MMEKPSSKETSCRWTVDLEATTLSSEPVERASSFAGSATGALERIILMHGAVEKTPQE
jgi:hypothetical protein